MSFELDLVVPIAEWEVAERLAEATAAPGVLSLVPGRRRRWFRALGPTVHLGGRDAQAVLDDQADWSEDEFTLSEQRHALAQTLLVIARELPTTEWTLRCSWGGDEIRAEEAVTADELADLVRGSKVNRYVRYHVSHSRTA